MKAFQKFEKRLKELGLYDEWCSADSAGKVGTFTEDAVIVLVHEGDGDAYTEFTFPPIRKMAENEEFRRRALKEYVDAGDEGFIRQLVHWYFNPKAGCPLFPVDVYFIWEYDTCVDFEDDEYAVDETTEEWCPHCDTCVDLESELKVQRCPNCGKWIVPCSVCPLQDCSSKCPLERLAILLNCEN